MEYWSTWLLRCSRTLESVVYINSCYNDRMNYQHKLRNLSPKNLIDRLSRIEQRMSRLEEKLDESLYHTNMLKNSRAIKLYGNVLLTTLFTGQKMYVDARDISVTPHLLVDGTWEPEITKVFREFVNEKSVVFDVGANLGFFGIIAGASNPAGIHFFEPNPELTPLIGSSIAINGLSSKTRINTVAIGEKKEELKLHLVGDYIGSSSLLDTPTVQAVSIAGQDVDTDRSFTVPVITLDQYCKDNAVKKVDVIKIDVEGFEPQVYKGMAKTIKNNKDLTVFLEFSAPLYKKPEAFYSSIAKDFKYVYAIDDDEGGKLVKLKDYAQLNKRMEHGWCMIVATNNAR